VRSTDFYLFAMAANQNETEKFRVLETVLVGSKVISNEIIKCVSKSVRVKDEKTVFADEKIVQNTAQPETESIAEPEEKTEKTDEIAAQPETESKAEPEEKTEKADEEAAQPETKSEVDAAQPETESKVEAKTEQDEEPAQPETKSEVDEPKPVIESKADDAVKTEKTDENAVAQPEPEIKVEKSDVKAAQPEPESEVAAAQQPETENKVDEPTKTEKSDEKAAQPETASKVNEEPQKKPKEDEQVETENKAKSADKPENTAGQEKPQIRRRKSADPVEDAATKIQALERQRQSKKKVKQMQEVMDEQEKERTRAATLIQNVQRRKSAMKKYESMRSEENLPVTEVTHALHDLLALGDPEELHANKTFSNLISAKADIDMNSEDGYTAIALACYYQGADVVSKLIELNANLNATGPQGDTLLIAATTRTPCEPDIITLLLDYPEIREKINVCENNYQTSALFLLCQEYDATHANHTRCENALKRMLEVKGVQVDITNSAGVTPLMMAVSNGSHNVAQILMDYGADPNKQDNRGNSALAIAGVGEDDLMWQILGGEFED